MTAQQRSAYEQKYQAIQENVIAFHNYVLEKEIALDAEMFDELNLMGELLIDCLRKIYIARSGLKREDLTLEVFDSISKKVPIIKERIAVLLRKRRNR